MIKRRWLAAIAALAAPGVSIGGTEVPPLQTASAIQARAPIVSSVEVRVGPPPSPVRIAGRVFLAYELHVTNVTASEVTLTRVAVQDSTRTAPIADLSDAALSSRIGRPGLRGLPDPRVIGPGLRAIVYFWLPFDTGSALPTSLRHHIGLTAQRAGRPETVAITGAEVHVGPSTRKPLAAPLRGGPWVALYDPLLVGGHRTAVYAVDGVARIPARFAIDFVRLSDDASHARGDREVITNWHGYGAEVLAVADATVVDARDDLAESPTLAGGRAPIPLEQVSGNYVSLDLGDGRYVFYEHLKHGSIRVKPGDRVKAGAVIGQLGNSGGSSSGPHLHFHVADAPDELAAEGLPFGFAGFDVVGTFDSVGAFSSGAGWAPPARESGGPRRGEMPAPNTVIVFPMQ